MYQDKLIEYISKYCSSDCNTLNAIAASLRHMGYDGLADALLTVQNHLSSIQKGE